MDVAFKDGARWLLEVSGVPESQLLVVSYRGEHELVEVVPGYVLDNRVVSLEVLDRTLSQLIGVRLVNIPEAHSAVIRA